MRASNIALYERFFRTCAGLDIDKTDVKRYEEFVQHKIRDLLLRAVAGARANGRDVIWPSDLPITKGLQENIHAFRELDRQIGLRAVLEDLVPRPVQEIDYDEETETILPEVAGGLSVALGNCFGLVYPDLKNPQTQHWDVAFGIFDQLL